MFFLGIHRSWKSDFMKERDQFVNANAVDTNNLIIRLDKLINDCTDESLRKGIKDVDHISLNYGFNSDFEKDTVPWTDNTVTACQSCSAKFHLARRKHHCRLCGNVICKDCSQFLPFVVARMLFWLQCSKKFDFNSFR